MNIYDFFNSPDVAEHCRSIGHTLNAVESAVMIDQCDSRTLAEKHAAYRTIITEYTDMVIPIGNNHNHISSFHKTLGEIIDYEEQIIKMLLLSESEAVYRVKIEDCDRGCCFSSYNKAITYAMEFAKDEEEAWKRLHDGKGNAPLADETENALYLMTEAETSKMPHIENSTDKFEINDITIQKGYIDSEKYIVARISRIGEIMGVKQSGVIVRYADDELDLLDSCYIDIPVPFQSGDLVEVSGYGHLFGRAYSPYGGVYVLKGTSRDNAEQNAKNNLRSDLMDMTADVYYERDGSVECEVIHFYPDLLYCRRKLEGETRILKYVSLSMQDKLCLCSLLKIQKYLLLDEKRSELKGSYHLQHDLDQIGDNLLC